MATPLSSALHLCKKIREDYSHISVGHLGRFAINRQQSMLLFNKVVETENTLEAIQVKLSQLDTTSSGFPNGGPVTKELVHVLRAAQTTIFKDCFCNGRWMESALRQGGDLKETFAEILYDLQWSMMVLCTIILQWIFQYRVSTAIHIDRFRREMTQADSALYQIEQLRMQERLDGLPASDRDLLGLFRIERNQMQERLDGLPASDRASDRALLALFQIERIRKEELRVGLPASERASERASQALFQIERLRMQERLGGLPASDRALLGLFQTSW
ncbi:unnamed protein product [Sphagnum jensenii]|uniref:Uncharacterized protein n=1 Tax=Sphagnum jensenii TaxID=128206 RepID=A0ABP1BJJ8_9BRYO